MSETFAILQIVGVLCLLFLLRLLLFFVVTLNAVGTRGLLYTDCCTYFEISYFLYFRKRRDIVFLLLILFAIYEGWNFNSGNYLFTTDTK